MPDTPPRPPTVPKISYQWWAESGPHPMWWHRWGWGLCVILQPATRGRPRCLAFTFWSSPVVKFYFIINESEQQNVKILSWVLWDTWGGGSLSSWTVAVRPITSVRPLSTYIVSLYWAECGGLQKAVISVKTPVSAHRPGYRSGIISAARGHTLKVMRWYLWTLMCLVHLKSKVNCEVTASCL